MKNKLRIDTTGSDAPQCSQQCQSTRKWIALLGMVLMLSLTAQADLAETIRGFERYPGYVQPVPTLMGTVLNSGWNETVRINKGFGWSFGVPVMIAYIGEEDHFYDQSMPTGCAEIRERGLPCPNSDDSTYRVPTLWGPPTSQRYVKRRYVESSTGQGSYSDWQIVAKAASGQEPMNTDLLTVPMPMLKTSFTYMYTELKLRYMGIPVGITVGSGGDEQTIGPVNFFGFGLQHDIRSILKKKSIDIPVDVALTANYSFWGFEYTPPKGDWTGSLELDGITTFHGLLVGKRWGKMELFAEMGYETSSMQTGGNLVDLTAEDGPESITPNLDVDGRNGLKFALFFTARLGSWAPVLSQGIGAQWGTTVNLINFRKESDDE